MAQFSHSLGHAASRISKLDILIGQDDLQVEEGELARTAAILIDEAASQIATENGPQIVLRDLEGSLACQQSRT